MIEPIQFGTKAETLERLSRLPGEALIPDFVYFTLKRWREERPAVLREIAEKLGDTLVVRSSAQSEDSAKESNAGAFLSILHVPKNDAEQFADAVEQVAASLPGEDGDQILVQNQVSGITVSGVIFTRCHDDGTPYYILNYDDESGKTDRVTGGIGTSKTLYVFRSISEQDFRSDRIRNLIALAKFLERTFRTDAIDLEFGIDKAGQAFLFQVRPIGDIGRWEKHGGYFIESSLGFIESFFAEQIKPRPGVFGERSVFGIMPDWNPAEMIGIMPRPLAASVYREIITRDVWRLAREKMGYRPLPGELMILIANHPYIDVRQSFNSFLPRGLSGGICARAVDAWLSRLREHPELHDKVEFAVAPTCLDFTFRETWEERYSGVLSAGELAELEGSLCRLTRGCLSGGTMAEAEADIQALREWQREEYPAIRESCADEPADLIQRLCILTYRVKTSGTLAFAVLARHAFIAESLLRSASARGALAAGRLAALRSSIITISGRMMDDLEEASRSRDGRKIFLREYGHLRPSSYDILSPCYSDRPEIFDTGVVQEKHDRHAVFTLAGDEKKALAALLSEFGLDVVSPEGLIAYAARAIANRENAKFIFTRTLSDMLETIACYGDRLGISRDELSFLDISVFLKQSTVGLLSPIRNWLREQIARNRELFESSRALRLPYLVTQPGDVKIIPVHRSAPNFVSSRRVDAPVVRVDSASREQNLSGRIVCIENADPGFDWIFTRNIAGLVTKFGGINSHMAVRCAEYSLPAAIGCGERLFEEIAHAGRAELDPKVQILRAADVRKI